MDEVDLIQSLINDLNELPHRDKNRLDALQKRANMIIKVIFGDSSDYLSDLNKIRFNPSVYPSSEYNYNLRWNSGKESMLNLFNTILEELELTHGIQNSDNIRRCKILKSNRVFVVHGHDGEMKLDVARTLEKLGLEPRILHEKPSGGRTIIEKFENYSDVNFAVVLLSPDDIGCSESDFPDGAKPRARQNVIFELGFFIGKLGRNRVAALYRGDDIEIPSDYDGVVYIPYDTSDGWKLKLVRELKECGYDIDMNKL